ncbi:MAG: nucleotidyltransferase domain-containing protein [Deltaproteobacteria bacterium]|nr:nucleotidyltransferase domain-containing protein [Deltaproteobacteria bacterium]
MTKKGLQKEIQSITRQLVENYGAKKVILFGSAARGEFSEDSDLDFLILKDNIPYYGKDRLLELDRLIKYRLPTDMFVYSLDEFENLQQMGDPFIQQILQEGKVLHG